MLECAPIIPSQKLIIIDGLDECHDSQAQVAILDAISRSCSNHNLQVVFLIVSRPEPRIVTSFHGKDPLRSIHRRLALDDTYGPDRDIRLFFSDKFEDIKRTHLSRSSIPISWPTEETLETLVKKSSGQFIYAATVVRFVESHQHQPPARLNIILEISPHGKINPFAELDALYIHLFASVEDIELTLRALSVYAIAPDLAFYLRCFAFPMSAEYFLSLEQGDVYAALIHLSSIVSYDESSGDVKILHASLVEFLSDKRRSTVYYLDIQNTCAHFTRRIFQYVKGPDGIRAGDLRLLKAVEFLHRKIPQGLLRNDILHFDLDAFIKAVIKLYYHADTPYGITVVGLYPVLSTFHIWSEILERGLDNEDVKQAVVLSQECLQSRIEIYQSNWQLQLLLTFATIRMEYNVDFCDEAIPYCRVMDILLEMDDHDIHLVDQDALDLRHSQSRFLDRPDDSIYAGGDKYASAALYCICFLSNPPKCLEPKDSVEMDLIYAEWKSTRHVTLDLLGYLLQEANSSQELVQFLCNRDVQPLVRKYCSVSLEIDLDLLKFEEIHMHDKGTDIEQMTRDQLQQRVDKCCSKRSHYWL